MAVSDWPSPPERWAENSLLVAFSFRCNLACTFCMVEDVLHVYEGTTLDAFRRHVEREGALRGIRRVIFSGGEVTLAKTLPDYIRFARSLPGIEHVRLQTNATRLSDRAYLDTLLRAGADEFFISLHGHDASTCDAITRRPGSFADILAGMRAVNDAGATLITNTAIAADNIRTLPRIVDTVAPFAPLSMELWSYWPRADESGARGHFVPLAEQLPFVLRTLEACVAAGIPPAVKWFPKCLLGEYALYHDDGQPPSVIELSARQPTAPAPAPGEPEVPDYFSREPFYACIYEGICEHAGDLATKGTPASGRCAGLSDPYIRHFGWETTLLQPHRRPPPGAPRGEPPSRSAEQPIAPRGAPPVIDDPARSLVADAGPRRTARAALATWLDRFSLAEGRPVAGWSLVRAVRSPDAQLLSLAFESGPRTVVIRVAPRDDSRRAPLRTPSFDLFYTARPTAPPAPVAALLKAVAATIESADSGSLALPPA